MNDGRTTRIDHSPMLSKDSERKTLMTKDDGKNASFRLVQLVKKPSLRSQHSASTVSTLQSSKCSSWSDLESSFASLKCEEEGVHLISCLKVKTQEESLGCIDASESTYKGKTTTKSSRFSTLEIREHPVMLGDNPSVIAGVPLTIEWHCQKTMVISVDEYEKDRPPRRHKNRLGIPPTTREDILKENGYTWTEIIEARRKTSRLQRERFRFANSNPMPEKWDEGKQSLNRKVKRWILRKPSDRVLCEQWREQQVAYCLEKQRGRERSALLVDANEEIAALPMNLPP